MLLEKYYDPDAETKTFLVVGDVIVFMSEFFMHIGLIFLFKYHKPCFIADPNFLCFFFVFFYILKNILFF